MQGKYVVKIKDLGNEKPILALVAILQFTFGLMLTASSFAWQTVERTDSTTRANTILALDSLPNLPSISHIDLKNSLDSLQSWQARLSPYQLNTDSLSPVQLQQIMALKTRGDSLLSNLETRQKQAEMRLNQLENKVTNLQDSIHKALRKKIGQLRAKGKLSPKADSLWKKLNHSAAMEKLNRQMGQLEIAGDKIGETDQLINQLKQEKISLEFTGDINQKLSELKGTLHEKEQLASVKTAVADVKSTFKEEIQQLNQKINPKRLSDRQQQLQQLGEYTDEIKTYGEQVGNMPETLEQRAREFEEVQAFESHKAEFSPYQEQMNQLGDQGYAREQVVKKAKTMAKDHFAGQQEKLKAAQSKLTTLKQQMGKLGGGSLNGEKTKKQNPMKGKTLGERLVVGGNFQLHPGEEVSMDISPALAYGWTKMFRLGLGGTYRTTFDEKERFFLSDENEVFGYRGFAEHEVYKGFYAHVEYERLKGNRRSSQNGAVGQGEGGAWQDGAMAGLGKTYKIRNKINGNVLLLYNFLFERGDTTSQSGPEGLYRGPWNLRFGFELIGQGSKKEKNEKKKSKSNKEAKKTD